MKQCQLYGRLRPPISFLKEVKGLRISKFHFKRKNEHHFYPFNQPLIAQIFRGTPFATLLPRLGTAGLTDLITKLKGFPLR